jgi:hypothetical protein
LTGASGVYRDRENPPYVFDRTVIDQNGNEIWDPRTVGATLGADGNYYVTKGNKKFKVEE